MGIVPYGQRAEENRRCSEKTHRTGSPEEITGGDVRECFAARGAQLAAALRSRAGWDEEARRNPREGSVQRHVRNFRQVYQEE